MHATKETSSSSLAALAIALLGNHIWNRRFDASKPPLKAPALNYRHLLAAVAVWFAIAVLFFSSFFTNGQGILDSLRV